MLNSNCLFRYEKVVRMGRKLPPLNSLKAFEAAARSLSFTVAAEELCVTQAAVSHQIKSLEVYLATKLFTRLHRRLSLTEEGEELYITLQPAFDEIAQTIVSIRQNFGRQMLKVRLAPSFAAKWLSPRLKQFRDMYPDIDLNLSHSSKPVDFRNEDVDVALTYGGGEWKDVECFPLIYLDFFPVCSPSLLNKKKMIKQPLDLATFPLLHDADYKGWENWLNQENAVSVNAHRGTIIDDTNVLIQAALDGQGVALGSSPFVADHIQSGRLVRLFDHELVSSNAYHFVCPPANLKQPAVKAFHQWLLTHVA